MSCYGGLEPVICLFEVERYFPNLVFVQLLCRSHLVECDQPLYDPASMVEILIRDLVHRPYYLCKEWMQITF